MWWLKIYFLALQLIGGGGDWIKCWRNEGNHMNFFFFFKYESYRLNVMDHLANDII